VNGAVAAVRGRAGHLGSAMSVVANASPPFPREDADMLGRNQRAALAKRCLVMLDAFAARGDLPRRVDRVRSNAQHEWKWAARDAALSMLISDKRAVQWCLMSAQGASHAD